MANQISTDTNGNSKPQKIEADQSGWYLIFISIIFGVLISVWIVPTGEMLFDEAQGPSRYLADFSAQDLNAVLSRLGGVDLIRGMLMFLILVSLWWWYGFFLAQIHPANGFPMYFFDFCSLCSFALAFRVWSDIYLFPLAVFLASTLMLIRFWFAKSHTRTRSNARHAIKVALLVLFMFLAAAMVATITVGFFFVMSNEEFSPGLLRIAWDGMHAMVMILLIIGIGVTVYAVKSTEGLKWGKPKSIDNWHATRATQETPGGD